jgi:phytoene dehydrogenase-like protein
VLSGLADARRDEGLPDGQLSTADWLARFTKNEAVHGIFRSMCGSVFAVGADELPARVFLTYFTRKSAFKKFGFCPQGTIGIWESLAKAITAAGGQVWLRSRGAVAHPGGRPGHGAVIERDGQAAQVQRQGRDQRRRPGRDGPAGRRRPPAARLHRCGQARRPAVRDDLGELRQPRAADPGTGPAQLRVPRRLCYAANFTATCPEMAPPGWHLYVGTAVPRPAIGDFDEAAETELLLADLHEEIPGLRPGADLVHGGDQGRLAAAAGRGRVRPAARHARSPTCGTSATGSRSTPTAARPPAPRPLSWSRGGALSGRRRGLTRSATRPTPRPDPALTACVPSSRRHPRPAVRLARA